MAGSEKNQRLGDYLVSTKGGKMVRALIPPPLPPSPPVQRGFAHAVTGPVFYLTRECGNVAIER